MTESYDVYRPPGSPVAEPGGVVPADGAGAWQVLVEFSNSGNTKPPTRIAVFDTVHDTFDAAHAAARDVATTYDPPDPAFPQGRRVYRDGDGFLTVIDGAMSTFHMSTRVVSLLESIDRDD